MGMYIIKSVQGLKSKCELLKEERNITPATIICYLTCITGKKKLLCDWGKHSSYKNWHTQSLLTTILFLIPVISGAAFLGQNSPGLD